MLKLEIQDYGHPTTHPAEMITQNPTHRMVTDQQIFDWETSTAPRVYFELAINEPPPGAGDFWLRLDDNVTLIGNGSIWMGTEPGQGMVKGICFLRQTTEPGIPVGGSFTNPTADGWSDGVPAGTDPLWMTTRLFTTNGSYPQQASWTAPVITSALGQGMRAMFSINGEDDPAGDWHEFGTVNDWFMRIDVSTDGGVTWTLGGVSKVKGEQGEIGVGQFKSTIFIRVVGIPGVPTGGDFANPVADGDWSDGIPVGTLPLWMSTRVFTGDGNPPQQAAWTIPQMTSSLGEGVQAEFSVDGLPPWSTDADPSDKYMRINTSDDGGLTWTYGVAVKVKGETGNTGGTGAAGQSVLKSTCFIRTNATPDAPIGGSYADPIADPDPTYGAWSDGTPAGVEMLWMTTRIFSSDALSPQQPSWTTPQPMGQIGDHANGAGVRYIFSTDLTPPALPPANQTTGWDTFSSDATRWSTQQVNTTDASGVIIGYGAWEVAIKVKGETGDSTRVRFSVDGTTAWHDVEDPADVYMRFDNSVDGKVTWILGRVVLIEPPEGIGSIPLSFAPGYVGGASNMIFTLNAVTGGAANLGEIRVQGSKFDHPDGTARVVQADSEVLTPYGEGAAGKFYLMWSDTVRATRFPTGSWGASTNVIPIRIVGGVWKAFDNLGNDYALTITATDVILASVEADATTGGLTGIQPFLGGVAQSTVVGICFLRGATQPATPTGGSYSSPTANGWSDGIPAGTLPIWSCTRLFSSDTFPPQQAAWTVPQKVGELGEGVRAKFSILATGPWVDPPDADETYAYMRIDNSINGGASWVTGAPIKVEGETGATGADGNDGADGALPFINLPPGHTTYPSGVSSDNWVEGSVGWAIGKGGNAEFFNIKIRGGADIYGNLSVLTAHINALAVTNAKIASLAVTEAKIDNLAVTTAKIALLAVRAAQIDALAVTEAKIDALAVTAAKIGTLAVTTAKIDNLAVTNIKIANLAVETIKIKDNAVTVPVSAYTSGIIACVTETEIQTVTLNAEGGSVFIACTVFVSHADDGQGGAQTITMRLKRGSTVLETYNIVTFGNNTAYYPISFSFRDTPTTGAKTYSVTAEDGGNAQHRSLTVLGVKK